MEKKTTITRTKCSSVCILGFIGLTALSIGQLTPAEKVSLSFELESKFIKHVEKNQFLEARGILDTVYGAWREIDRTPNSPFYIAVAKMNNAFGDSQAEKRAYERSLFWYGGGFPPQSEHVFAGGSDSYIAYIRYLLRHERDEDAVRLYYAMMRQISGLVHVGPADHDFEKEKLPILVVFAPDTYAESWSYSRPKLELLLKIFEVEHGTREEKLAVMEEAHDLVPSWYLPVAHKAFAVPYKVNETFYQEALALAPGEKERTWVVNFRRYHTTQPIDRREDPEFPVMADGHAERRKIPLLEAERLALIPIYRRLSAGFQQGKFHEFWEEPDN